MSNSSALITGVVAALGTVTGGFVVVMGSWLSTRRQRHARLKTALRLLRNDFYADEHKVAYALKKEAWWPEFLQLRPLATPDDFAVVASEWIRRFCPELWAAHPPHSLDSLEERSVSQYLNAVYSPSG